MKNSEPIPDIAAVLNEPNANALNARGKRKQSEKSGITRPKQKFDLVEVWWDDASGLPSGWDDKVPTVEHQICLSVGFLIHETPDHIILAMDLDASGNHNGRSQIPRGMVKYMKVLKKAGK